jgi:hypothetical protein
MPMQDTALARGTHRASRHGDDDKLFHRERIAEAKVRTRHFEPIADQQAGEEILYGSPHYVAPPWTEFTYTAPPKRKRKRRKPVARPLFDAVDGVVEKPSAHVQADAAARRAHRREVAAELLARRQPSVAGTVGESDESRKECA